MKILQILVLVFKVFMVQSIAQGIEKYETLSGTVSDEIGAAIEKTFVIAKNSSGEIFRYRTCLQ